MKKKSIKRQGIAVDLGPEPDAALSENSISTELATRPSPEPEKHDYLSPGEYAKLVNGMTQEQASLLGQNLLKAAKQIRERQIAASLIGNTEELLRLKAVHEQRIAESVAILKNIEEKMRKIADGLYEIDRDARIIFK